MSSLIKFRRGLEADLPALNVGEPAIAVDTHTLWIGTPAGNVVFSRDLQEYIDEHSKFLEDVTPLVENMVYINEQLDVDTLKQMAIDLKDGVDFTKRVEDVEQAVEAKVDRVPGKYLSTNDYTTAEKTKLGGLYQVIVRDSVTSTNQAEAASAASVKKAYDEALLAKQQASDGKSVVAAAVTGKGVSATGSDTFAALASKITSIPTGATGTSVTHGLIGIGGKTVTTTFPMTMLVLSNTEEGEVVVLSPTANRGFATGEGYEFKQGKVSVTWNASKTIATLSGTYIAQGAKWVAIG